MEIKSNPHQNQPLLQAGLPLADANAAMILIHGRGAGAADILTLAQHLHRPDFAYLAPQAADYTWYPYSFLAPVEDNQPGIDSGLQVIAGLLETLAESGIPPEKTILLGFSQGACLSLEFVARRPARYGGVAGLSGGLIGPPGTTWEQPGSLDGTPSSSAAATPIHTSPNSASKRPLPLSPKWALTSPSGSTPAWGTSSTKTSWIWWGK